MDLIGLGMERVKLAERGGMRFWLGVHQTNWLEELNDVPLFVSTVRLRKRKRLPRATTAWALDSGGFNAIRLDGCYSVGPHAYAAEVRRYSQEIGGLQWAAIQDWMCEPFMLEKTGKTVSQHQQLTVNSWIALKSIDASLPWVPVLQGYTLDDYHNCVDLYERFACTRLENLPLVGLGSVCRRQGTAKVAEIVKSLYARGLKNLHGFGMKTLALTSQTLRTSCYLESADSMAWSTRARNAWNHHHENLCGFQHGSSCANCRNWAVQWRQRLCKRIWNVRVRGRQELLF